MLAQQHQRVSVRALSNHESMTHTAETFSVREQLALKLAPYPKPAITILIFFSCCHTGVSIWL